MLETLPDSVLSWVVLHLDNVHDVKNLFAASSLMGPLAADQKLMLMWLEKNRGADVAFEHAARLGDLRFAHSLIPKMDDGAKRSALLMALERGIVPLAELLLDPQTRTDINAPTSAFGTRLLHVATDASTAALLLAVPGIDVNVTDFLMSTPLHLAASHGREGVISALLAVPGIDINVRNIIGRTPLHKAAMNGHNVVIDMLRGVPGIDVNIRDFTTQATALHLAASHKAVTALLAVPGIDVNAVRQQGLTALHEAVFNRRVDIVKELLAAPGIDVNVADVRGHTPLHAAALVGDDAIIEAILAVPGVHVNARDGLGRTPLHHAERWGHTHCIALLACP